ncbi:MAG TPA: hypothetical protein VFP25_05375 [Nitrososphaeraceae archaeon]|nr:hypothetical protein [Nitrososphaeraceae archaeon]
MKLNNVVGEFVKVIKDIYHAAMVGYQYGYSRSFSPTPPNVSIEIVHRL